MRDLCVHGMAFCVDCAYAAGLLRGALIVRESIPEWEAREANGASITQALDTVAEKLEAAGNEIAGPRTTKLDVTTPLADCVPCLGCGGMRRENCKAYGKHQHDWCDCQ